ncbi:hypothetical protein VTJ49DRAFT_6235 [Mycothermus thermophilus]|uniref:Secreted protein n=1 Tax=Humicola insolens TaxID=85995 RepID=A0ABR3VJI8_HUMIN
MCIFLGQPLTAGWRWHVPLHDPGTSLYCVYGPVLTAIAGSCTRQQQQQQQQQSRANNFFFFFLLLFFMLFSSGPHCRSSALDRSATLLKRGVGAASRC